MSPTSSAVLFSSTRSVTVTLPMTLPWMMTDLVLISARMTAFWPTESTPSEENVAFHGAVNQQVIGKTQGTDYLHIGVQHIAGQLLDTGGGSVGRRGFRNRFGDVLALGYIHPAGGGFRIFIALGGGNGSE